MRKVYFLLCILMMTACASAPSWKGMSESEISAWKDMGVTVEQVGAYVKAGLSHPQVKAWIDNEFSNQNDILAWAAANFTPEQAKAWRDVAFNLDDAIAWATEKFSPTDAKAWRDGGFDLDDAVDNRAKGLQPVK